MQPPCRKLFVEKQNWNVDVVLICEKMVECLDKNMVSWKLRDICRNPSPPGSPPLFEEVEVEQELDKESIASSTDEKKFKFNPNFSAPVEEISDPHCKWDPNLDAYYCEVCESTMNSEHTYNMHLRGKRHQKKLATVRLVSDVQVDVPRHANMQEIRVGGEHKVLATKQLTQPPKIQQALDKEKQPIIGLSYVTEILRLDKKQDPVYHCSLCPADCQLSSIIGHVTGLKHRMSYMKLNRSDVFASISNCAEKRSSQSDRAEYYATRVEREDGRGTMIVEEEMDPTEEMDVDDAEAVSMTEEELKYMEDNIKTWLKLDKMEVVQMCLEDIFAKELQKPVFEGSHVNSVKKMCSDMKQACINGAMAHAQQDTHKKIIDGDHSFADDLLKFGSMRIGTTIKQVIGKLVQKGEFQLD